MSVLKVLKNENQSIERTDNNQKLVENIDISNWKKHLFMCWIRKKGAKILWHFRKQKAKNKGNHLVQNTMTPKPI